MFTDFRVGDRVWHENYGVGIIIRLGEGYIEREYLYIMFDGEKNERTMTKWDVVINILN